MVGSVVRAGECEVVVTLLDMARDMRVRERVDAAGAGTARKVVSLATLEAGETGRVVRVNLPDLGCRRRFAELGLAEGMKVTVVGTGDVMMLNLAGAKMGLAERCAREVYVVRVAE